MRLFIATLGTETNTFVSFPTGLQDFKNHLWAEKGIENASLSPSSAPAKLWLKRARELGWEVAEGLHAFAKPGGRTTRSAYETMRDRILSDLAEAGPVDAVLMFMHGAMVADGHDDCEADTITRIRQMVGPSVRIGVELDPHAHIDDTLVSAADLIVFYKTYPHIDHSERADDLFTLMKRTLAGEISPVMALFDCKVMGLFPTTREGPMVQFTADLFAAEGKDGILSLSLNHGFPWGDVPNAGAKMLAVADGDIGIARRAAEAFGRRFYRDREAANLPFVSPEEAIRRALEPGDKPIVLADVSDQAGGGAPGDTTYLLNALIEAGIRDSVIAPFWDPLAVGICLEVGTGARLRMRIGGKFGPESGPSRDVDAEVMFLKRDAWQEEVNGQRVAAGDIAVIRTEGIDILLTTRRTNVHTASIFTFHGISLDDKRVIGVKNLYKHQDRFRPLSRDQLFVATPGAASPDWHALPYARLPRPIWPLDPDPLG